MVIIAKGSNSDFEYEKVRPLDEWIGGSIEEVQPRMEHTRWDGKIVDQVRFKFKLENHEFNHYSGWMTLSTNEKSNLYKKYIKGIFGNRYKPNENLDVSKLCGLHVLTMWEEIEGNDGKIYERIYKIKGSDDNQLDMIDMSVKEDK